MKPLFPKFHQKAWDEHKKKSNRKLVGLFTLMLFMCSFLFIGGLAQPKSKSGVTITAVSAAMSVIAVPFAKRQGSLQRMFKEDDDPEGGGHLSKEAEKSILDKVKLTVKEQMDKQEVKGVLTDEDRKKFNDFFNAADGLKTMKDLQAMSANLEELGLKFQSSQEKAKSDGPGGFLAGFKQSWAERKSDIDQIIDGGQKSALVIEVKAAVVMGEDNTIGAGTTQNSLTSFSGIISAIRSRVLTYLKNVSVGTTNSKIVYWIEETDQQGTPIFIGEGDGKTQLSVKYVEKTATVKKIAVYGKVTTEMMADLGQLISYIKNNLLKRMDIVTEDQLFNGNNVGDNLNGLIPQATAFVAPVSLALQVPDANEYDVLQAAGLQSKTGFGQPNAWFIHPATRSKMLLLKDTMGQYIFPRWASPDAMKVDGQTIIETTAMTEGDFVGGDLTVVNVLVRESATIQIGLDGNDFTNNVKTILVEQRLVQFISANDTQVLIKGDFASAKAALVEPT